MSDTAKPRRVKAKITRTVTEWAIVTLDRNGNLEEFEETIEEPEEEPEPEPSEPIELAMPVYTAEELLQKAHAAGDDPKVIEDPATGITILDYSDIL